MKRVWLAGAAVLFGMGSASAADLPMKAPVLKAAPVAVWDWTGPYIGAYAGVGVQQSRGKDPVTNVPGVLGTIEYTGAGFAGGGTAGYNWQFGRNWVVGVEGDIGYLGLDRTNRNFSFDLDSNSKTSGMATLRGRIGWSRGPTLSYLTGGAAFVHIDDVADTRNCCGGAVLTSSKTKSGYALGSGVETMLDGNWTAKAEYLFVDVGAGDTQFPGTEILQIDKHRFQLMKFGANYRFGGNAQPPLPAHNWNGLYAGVVGGSAVTSARGTDPTGAIPGEIGNNGTGYTIGGLAGYNWQFTPSWVAGVEGDLSWLGVNHTVTDYYNDPGFLQVKTNWLATLRGRLGYSTGPALLYATAGGAWVNVRDSFVATYPVRPLGSSSRTLSGYAVGGGIETAWSARWSTRTEYLFVDAGDGDTLDSGSRFLRVDHQFHVFRAALTYSFSN